MTTCFLRYAMKPFQKGLLLKERICSQSRANSFLEKLTPIEKGIKIENGRVAVPE